MQLGVGLIMDVPNSNSLDGLSAAELMQLGYAARKAQDHSGALGWFELALQKNPKNTNVSIECARTLLDKGDVDAGREILTSLVHLDQFVIYALLGRADRLKGNREKALHYYSLAFDLKPDHPTLPAEIATELRVLGRLDEAQGVLLSLFERLPSSPHALNGLAQIARICDDREQALSYYRALETLDPNHPNVHIDIAIELRELGRLDEAAQSLAISCNPNPGAIFHQKGLIAVAQENDDLAIECFKAGIEKQRDHHACYQALIAKFFQLGNFEQMRKSLDTALGIFPNHTAFRRFEYRHMRSIGKVNIAIDLVQSLHKTEFNNFDVVHDFVEYLIFLGEFERASKLIEPWANNSHKDRFLFLKSKLAMAQFDLGSAVTCIDEAILINPKNIQYQQHRISLNIMAGNISGAQDDVNGLKVKFQSKGWGNKQLKSVGGFPAQILREINLNPYANKSLANLKQTSPGENLRSVAKIFKDEPNHLGLAIRLLTLLAQDKRLNQRLKLLDDELASKIPKNLIQFWDTKDVPPEMAEVMQSWRSLNPGFNYQLFNDQSAQEFIWAYHSPDVLKAFRMANHPAMRSDLFRLAYLYEFGGIYVDADDLCINPIDEFTNIGVDLLLIQESTGSIGNNFLAVKAKHPFIQFALQYVVNNILNKAGGVWFASGPGAWFASGPGALTISFCQMYIELLEQEQTPSQVAITEIHNLHQYVTPHLKINYKRSSRS